MEIVSQINNKELILTLIKADMRNVKLITGLEQAGALVEHFHTDLSVVILKLMGFTEAERTDELYAFYDQQMDALLDVSVGEFQERLGEMAVEFYLLVNSKQ